MHTGLELVAGMAALERTVNATSGCGWPSGWAFTLAWSWCAVTPSEPLTLGGTCNDCRAPLSRLWRDPDTVVISEATRRLVERDFLWEPLGGHMLEGLAQPLTAYRLLQERPWRQARTHPVRPARADAVRGPGTADRPAERVLDAGAVRSGRGRWYCSVAKQGSANPAWCRPSTRADAGGRGGYRGLAR